MTVGKADDTCFNALNPRNAVSPQRTAHRNGVAPHERLPRMVSRASPLEGRNPPSGDALERR
ncbi:hypothetical protein LC593_24230 [Nostoc sp. CHAB 5844]|nr:hypothetical protein [Nostoc sp. CHAB 5844]